MKKLFILLSATLSLLVSCQPARSSVTLALLGDLMLGRGVDPTQASLSYLAPELQAADLSFANLESPLANVPPATDARTGYNLCALSTGADLLFAWGLDLLSLANNHQNDCGPEGAAGTITSLTRLGIIPLGPTMEQVYKRVNGLKLAFLALDDILAPMDGDAAVLAIRSARAQGAVVVVSVHWGMEYQAGASDRQKVLAQKFAEAGAALVVGTHPHVLQPAAWIKTAWGKTLVLYSLGNALFDQPGLPDTRQSALVLVRLDAHGVQSARAVPFVIDVPRSLIIQADAQTAQQIRTRINLP